MASLAAAVFGTDAEAAVRVYRTHRAVDCIAAVWIGSRRAG
jgi:hypothetical protein